MTIRHDTNQLRQAHELFDEALRIRRDDPHRAFSPLPLELVQAAATLAVADQLAYLSWQINRAFLDGPMPVTDEDGVTP